VLFSLEIDEIAALDGGGHGETTEPIELTPERTERGPASFRPQHPLNNLANDIGVDEYQVTLLLLLLTWYTRKAYIHHAPVLIAIGAFMPQRHQTVDVQPARGGSHNRVHAIVSMPLHLSADVGRSRVQRLPWICNIDPPFVLVNTQHRAIMKRDCLIDAVA